MIAVLDYGIGNLASAKRALTAIGAEARLVSESAEAEKASGVVLPGVGAFSACAFALSSSGLDETVRKALSDKRPVLAICVGMQLLFESSEESPGVAGLGLLPGRVRRLPAGQRRPQMQWNLVTPKGKGGLLEGPEWFYFVHGYYAEPTEGSDVAATCEYGVVLTAAVARGSLFATQFHPEKSGRAGLQLLGSFVARCEAA